MDAIGLLLSVTAFALVLAHWVADVMRLLGKGTGRSSHT